MKDVNAHSFIAALSKHFKKNPNVNIPDWVDLVKTGVQKELGPLDEDWYYTRMGKVFSSTSTFILFRFVVED